MRTLKLVMGLAWVAMLAAAFLAPPLMLTPAWLLVPPIAGASYLVARHAADNGFQATMRWVHIGVLRFAMRYGWRPPFPGYPLVAGGSTAPAVTPPPTPPPPGMTQADLEALITQTAEKSLGPAILKALEPVTKVQGDLMERLMKGATKDEPGATGFDDRTLGAYPIGRKIRAMAMATISGNAGDPEAAIHAIKKAPGWAVTIAEPTIKWLTHVKTTLSAGNASAAGAMILPSYDPQWIELLRNNTVVRGIARTIPMPTGATTRRKQTGASTAYYQGENQRATPSNPTVGLVNLSYKKLVSLVVVSNDLIRFAGADADRIVQEDMLRQSALREDQALLVGNPPTDAGSPQGVRYQTLAANIFASAGASLANFQADLTTAIRNVQKRNIPATPQNSYFILSPSTFWTIYALATTTGDMIFASMLSGPTPMLFGFPVRLSTQLETSNSFIGASQGMIMFVYAPALEIHDALSRTVESFRGGAYYDPTLAAVASGISNDETVVTCIAEHDFLQVYGEAASIITGYAT